MKRLSLFAMVLVVGMAVVAPAFAQKDKDKDKGKDPKQPWTFDLAPYTGPKKRLAVQDLEIKSGNTSTSGPSTYGSTTGMPTADAQINTDFGTGLTEMLTSALMDCNRFTLVERRAFADIVAEQQLAAGGGFNQDTAAKAGGLMGAQALVRGAITEFSLKKSSTGGSGLLSGLGLSHSEAEAVVALDIRIFDVTTGVLMDSVRGEGKIKSSATSVDFTSDKYKFGGDNFATSPLGLAARKAIIDAVQKICGRMEKLPWEAKVADIDKDGDAIKYCYINSGSKMGLKVGDSFDIYRPGTAIIDPDTKLPIGRKKDTYLGKGHIESLTEGLSTVLVTEGTDVQAGDIVRYVKPAAQ